MRTRVKICGITRPEHAHAAADLGVDAIGLVFAEASPRFVTIERAAEIADVVPPFITVVGLFMNPSVAQVAEVAGAVPLSLLQFHGDEPPQLCRAQGLPYIKAVPMGGGVDPFAYAGAYDDARGFLLDSHAKGGAGGAGKAFEWAAVPTGLGKPLILAGGLTPVTVAEAIRQVRPYAVDVSSGVEAAKGIKDAAKMAAFMRGVHESDN